MNIDHSTAACRDCVWARAAKVIACDSFATSESQAGFDALYCHRERPRERVAPDCFCPDFEMRGDK